MAEYKNKADQKPKTSQEETETAAKDLRDEELNKSTNETVEDIDQVLKDNEPTNDDLDAILDEFDELNKEIDAEAFVSSFVQKGGQ